MQKFLVLKDTDIILRSLYLAMCTQCPHNDRTNTLPTMRLLKLILIQKIYTVKILYFKVT